MEKLRLRLKMMLQRLKNNEGVTLIELLAVVVILAIIAAVGVPVVLGQINSAKVKTDKANEQIIVDALNRAEFDASTSSSGGLYFKSLGPITPSGATFSTAGSVYSVLTGSNNGGPFLESIPQTSSNGNFSIESSPGSGVSVPFTFPSSSTGPSLPYYVTN